MPGGPALRAAAEATRLAHDDAVAMGERPAPPTVRGRLGRLVRAAAERAGLRP